MVKSFPTTGAVEEMVGIDEKATPPTLGDCKAVGSESDGKPKAGDKRVEKVDTK